MFSGCRSQGTPIWGGLNRPERRRFVCSPSAFLRHIWAAHINDQKRNQGFERPIQCRIFHAQSIAHGETPSIALKSSSTQTSPLLPLEWPEIPNHRPPLPNTNHPSQGLDNIALQKTTGKGKPANSILRSVPVDQYEEAPLNEDLHREAARTPKRAQSEADNEINGSSGGQRPGKSFLSYDWRVSLKLLKKYCSVDASLRENRAIIINKVPQRQSQITSDKVVHEPTQWSHVAFDRYVHDLVNFEPPPMLISKAPWFRNTPKGGPRNITEIGDTIHGLMNRKELRKFLNPMACNAAIDFFARHGMMSKAQSLFYTMEHLSIPISVSSMHIFMRAAAHLKDLHTFSWLLVTMIKRGIRPDSETWIIFTRFFDSGAVKSLIIQEMTALGMLRDPRIAKMVVSSTIREDIVSSLQNNQDPRDFLQQKGLEHGPGWLNTKRGNVIFNEVCKRSSIAAGLDLLRPLQEHGFKPDIVTLNIPLFQTIKRGSIPLASYVLDTFATKYKIFPDQMGYQKLFKLAHDRGYLNVSRLLWIAACLEGTVNMYMQAKVRHSLYVDAFISGVKIRAPVRLTSLPAQASIFFKRFMGKFVLGFPPFETQTSNQWIRMITKNLRKFKTVRLKCSLGYNLREAHKLDREWRFHEGKDVEEKLQHGYLILLADERSFSTRPRIYRMKKFTVTKRLRDF